MTSRARFFRALRVVLLALAVLVASSASAAPRLVVRDYLSSGVFNGTTSNVQSGANTGISGTTALSMSVWFRTPTPSANQFIMSLGAAGAGNDLALVTSASGGSLGWFNSAANNQGGSITANAWQHGALTYNGTTVSVYLNGVAVRSGDAITQTLTNSKLFIAESWAGTGFFSGQLADVCLWSGVALSPAQVLALYAQGVVPTSGLIRRYKLSDGNGTTPVDSSPTGDTSTSTALTWSLDSPMKARPATRSFPFSGVFNGTSSFVQSGTNTGISGAAPFSSSVWVKLANTYSGSQVLTYVGGIGATNQLILYVQSGTANLALYNGSTFASSTRVGSNAWHHVAATYDGANARAYVDGTLVLGPTAVTLAITNNKFFVGWSPNADGQVNGSLADACLWSRSLSAAEVRAVSLGQAPPTSGLIRRYQFAEGTGSLVSDSSATGDTATGTTLTWSYDAPSKGRGLSNFFRYSQGNFSAAFDTKSGVTFVENAGTAPDGTNTASALTFAAASYADQTISVQTTGPAVAKGSLTISMWLMSPTKATIGFRLAGEPSNPISCTLLSLTPTWTRYTFAATLAATDTTAFAGFDNRSVVCGDNTAGTLYAWGAQVNPGTTALPYVATGANPSQPGNLAIPPATGVGSRSRTAINARLRAGP